MCVIEAVIAVMSSGRPMELPDGTRLTPGEAAGMLSRLDFPQQWLILAKGGDSEARALLRGWLWQEAAEMAVKRGWRATRGASRLEGMAEVVCRELSGGKCTPLEIAECLGFTGYKAKANYWLSPWTLRLQDFRKMGRAMECETKARLKDEFYSNKTANKTAGHSAVSAHERGMEPMAGG